MLIIVIGFLSVRSGGMIEFVLQEGIMVKSKDAET
jgi:hypothetical protein